MVRNFLFNLRLPSPQTKNCFFLRNKFLVLFLSMVNKLKKKGIEDFIMAQRTANFVLEFWDIG